jgi:serine/threonine-protein kinase
VASISAYLALSYFIRNEDSVTVPELVGKESSQVLVILGGLGLNTNVDGSEYSSQFPVNHVIFQDPEPGTVIKKGRNVRVIYSKGMQAVFVPSFVHTDLMGAQNLLSGNGLSQGTVSYAYSDIVPKNAVISQYPENGASIERGSSLNFLVSLGKPPISYLMGDLSGKPLDEAMTTIEQSHLVMGTIRGEYNESRPLNTVTSQEPKPGSRVLTDSKVNLVVNRVNGESAANVLKPSEGPRLFRYKVQAGFLKKHIRIQLNSGGNTSDLYNGQASPGEDIWVMVPENTAATVQVYDEDTLVETKTYE